jgi:hypothetical protein
MIPSPDDAEYDVRACHVSFARHALKNAPTVEEGEAIVERSARAINCQRSWAASPPAGITAAQLDSVLDSYFGSSEVSP